MSKQIMDDFDAGFQAGQHDLNRIVVLREDLAYEKGLDRALFAVRNIDRQMSKTSRFYHAEKDLLYKIYEEIKKQKGTNENL